MNQSIPRGILTSISALLLWHSSASLAQETSGRIVEAEGIRSFSPEGDSGEEVNLPEYLNSIDPTATRWYQHVQTLANPWFEGRRPGSRGGRLAAEYISWYFGTMGLEPIFESPDGEPTGLREEHDFENLSWYQPFEFNPGRSRRSVLFSEVTMPDSETPVAEDMFNPLGNSGSGAVTAPITFVGYGIDEGPDGYTSFDETTDLSGRVAMLLRYEPLDADGKSRWADGENFSEHAGVERKFQSLVDRGAAGVILVNPPGATHGRRGIDSFRYTRRFRPVLDVPAVHMDPETADALLQAADERGRGLETLTRLADAGGITTVDGIEETRIALDVRISRPELPAQNVAGVLPGRGELADEWIVIGGHYDHIGYGYVGSRSNSEEIHFGADDNASGVGAILVLAERLSEFKTDGDRRSIVFIGFDAEEAGLHGSDWFLEHCPIDPDSINCMINMDMMGRLRENTLSISGTGTAVEFDELLPRHIEPSGLVVRASPGGLGPSDHSNFFKRDVPVLFFFTGDHDDYHTPRDRAWLLNPEGTARIIDLAGDIAEELLVAPDQLTFRESTEGGRARRSGAKVRLGIMPSYTADITTGVLIDGISSGTSAADAGLKKGDIILRWDDIEITDGSVLMTKIMSHNPGDVPVLRILRDQEELDIPVKLKSPGGS